jgi:sugar phosphate isomerase/epimerase
MPVFGGHGPTPQAGMSVFRRSPQLARRVVTPICLAQAARFSEEDHRTMKVPLFCCVLAVTLSAFAEPAFQGEAGLQLYSLRDQFAKDVPGTLDRVREYGVKQVETASLYNLPAAELRKMLESRGLTPVSGHAQYEALRKDVAAVIRDAKAVGQRYVVCPWIPHEIANFSEQDVKSAAQDFNAWGEAMKKEGLTFAYHPHGYEFRPYQDGTLFDLLAKETKPELVAFEMDVFWVVHPGQDPVKLLEKYAGRWQLMHLKDIRKGAQTGIYTGKAPKTDDVPLGTGMVDWPAVLRAAAKAGVKHYFIEDESPTAPTAIAESLRYLETLRR